MPSFRESVQVDGSEMELYVSVPNGAGPFPGVVVIHHGFGVDQFIQDITDRLAGEGYAAVAPNLFHRMTESSLADGSPQWEHLSDPETVVDVNATVEFLRSHPAIIGERLGTTGFCLGGRIVWLAAATNPHLKAAVPYYGGNIMVPRGKATQSPFELTSQIECPMLFHFGEIDSNPSQEDMAELDAELTRLGKPHQFFTYAGADHGFMNHHLQEGYHKEAAEASWPRTLDFFATHLKGAAVR